MASSSQQAFHGFLANALNRCLGGPATMRLHRRKSEGCSVILISKFLDEVWRLLLNAFAHGERALQGKARNLVFTHECDAWMVLSVCDEFFQHPCAGGTSRNTVMSA